MPFPSFATRRTIDYFGALILARGEHIPMLSQPSDGKKEKTMATLNLNKFIKADGTVDTEALESAVKAQASEKAQEAARRASPFTDVQVLEACKAVFGEAQVLSADDFMAAVKAQLGSQVTSDNRVAVEAQITKARKGNTTLFGWRKGPGGGIFYMPAVKLAQVPNLTEDQIESDYKAAVKAARETRDAALKNLRRAIALANPKLNS